jgi:N6-adenosine-specific RNA methylase IME4
MIDLDCELLRAAAVEGGFRLILADPPWRFDVRSDKGRGRSAERHYETMSLERIAALPVGELAAEDCLLWLWACNPMLPHALDVMAAWGARFLTSGVWCKRARGGGVALGTGYWLRSSSEPFLLGAWGKPSPGSRSVSGVIEAARREHSRKPEAAYRAAEALAPEGPRLELFAREARPGWAAWGDDVARWAPGLEGAA